MDFNFADMTHAAAEAKCRTMWPSIAENVPIGDESLITFLLNDPGFAERRKALKGDITYVRKINKRTGATTFYARGSEGGETWASWPNALRAILGMDVAPRSPWDAVFNAFYDPVKPVIREHDAMGHKMLVPFNDFLFAWMTINGYSKADLSFNTPDNVGRFSAFFANNAVYVNKKREADGDAEEGGAAKKPRDSIE